MAVGFSRCKIIADCTIPISTWNGVKSVWSEKYRRSFPQTIGENGRWFSHVTRDSMLSASPIQQKDVSGWFFLMYSTRLSSGKTCHPVPPPTNAIFLFMNWIIIKTSEKELFLCYIANKERENLRIFFYFFLSVHIIFLWKKYTLGI